MRQSGYLVDMTSESVVDKIMIKKITCSHKDCITKVEKECYQAKGSGYHCYYGKAVCALHDKTWKPKKVDKIMEGLWIN